MRLLKVISGNKPVLQPRAYLFKIARTQLINQGMKKKAKYSLEDDSIFSYRTAASDGQNPEEWTIANELMQHLKLAVNSLDDSQNEIFEFRWNLGMKLNEIASIIGINERQVRRIFEKIILILREYFSSHGWQLSNGITEASSE